MTRQTIQLLGDKRRINGYVESARPAVTLATCGIIYTSMAIFSSLMTLRRTIPLVRF